MIGVARAGKRSISLRLVLLVLAGLMIVTLASGIVWFTTHHAPLTRNNPASPTGEVHASPAGIVTEFLIPAPNSYSAGIAVGPDGNLWFTEDIGYQNEISDSKIGRITPGGTITEFPLPTANSGPQGITPGPDGNLWFTESVSNMIGRITPRGAVTEFPLPTAYSNPWGITPGPDGNLWFTGLDMIGRITPSGTVTEFPLPVDSSPVGIVAGRDGNLWFTAPGSDKIGRITSSGSITEFPLPPGGSNPQWITAGPDGNLWFTDPGNSEIGRVTLRGTITEFPLPETTAITFPIGITAGPDGNLWFTEEIGKVLGSHIQVISNQIGRITPGGVITRFSLPAATGNSGLQGITTGPDGNLWFTEGAQDMTENGVIGRITSGK